MEERLIFVDTGQLSLEDLVLRRVLFFAGDMTGSKDVSVKEELNAVGMRPRRRSLVIHHDVMVGLIK